MFEEKDKGVCKKHQGGYKKFQLLINFLACLFPTDKTVVQIKDFKAFLCQNKCSLLTALPTTAPLPEYLFEERNQHVP